MADAVKVLVTGAAGFIGFHTAKALLGRGDEVLGLDDLNAYYDPALERGIAYDDPDLAIAWPAELELLVSDRDRGAPQLREIAAELPFSYVQR